MENKEIVPASILVEERDLMTQVYLAMDAKLGASKKRSLKQTEYAMSENYDDHDKHTAYNEAVHWQKKYDEESSLYGSLHAKPYFAHLGITGRKRQEMLLSDN